MKQRLVVKVFLFGALLFLVLSVVLSVVSLFPITSNVRETSIIIDDSFRLTPLETRRHCLGSFHGGENVSTSIRGGENWPINFSIQTYNGTRYSTVSTAKIDYSFTAGADYYEAVFLGDSKNANEIHFEVSVQKPRVSYPFSGLATPAKVLFLFSLSSILLLLLKFAFTESAVINSNTHIINSNAHRTLVLSQKSRRKLLIMLLLSLTFWLFLLAVNNNPLGTFENWYTDHARHPYSSILFIKVGFSVFDTPLGKLASNDSSFYKFVTWPQNPHLYPLGSIFLFLPFGFLLENGVDQLFVFKMEIALFLLVAHICLYYFLTRFLKQRMNLLLKALGIYILYVALVVYSANGMFDSIAFLFSVIALTMYLEGRYDYSILFVAVSVTLKYQAGIFLFPLVFVGLKKLLEQNGFSRIIENKAIVVAAVLAGIDGFTAYLSAPFLMEARPELVMNGVNAFSPHSQAPWALQSFAVLLTLTVTLLFAVYLLHSNSLISLYAVFVLLPSFTMPYFQPWYLPFFFVWVLIPKQKREVEVTMLWVIFTVTVLSFGWVSFNPLQILDNLRKLLRL
jgi:hypothetical protein